MRGSVTGTQKERRHPRLQSYIRLGSDQHHVWMLTDMYVWTRKRVGQFSIASLEGSTWGSVLNLARINLDYICT